MSDISPSRSKNGGSIQDEEHQNFQKLRVAAEKEELIISPINLTIRASVAIQLPRLVWYNFHLTPKKIKVTNTGHTVILSAKWYDKRPFITEGPLLSNYVFSQVHFHWGLNDQEGSEHTVDGKRYPLEMHVVHFKSEYKTQEDALLEKDGLIVIGYFFQIQEHDNPCMEEIVNVFSCIVRPHTSARVDVFRVEQLFRPFTDDYFLYWGSVMSASCYHQILWAFNREPIGISSPQLSKFRQLSDKDGNPLMKTFRSTNSLGKRTLFHVNPSDYLSTTLLPISVRDSFNTNQTPALKTYEPIRSEVQACYAVDRGEQSSGFSAEHGPSAAQTAPTNLPYKIIINDLHQVELVYKPTADVEGEAVQVITIPGEEASINPLTPPIVTSNNTTAFSLNCMARRRSDEMDGDEFNDFGQQKSVSFNRVSQVQFPNKMIGTELAKGVVEEETSDSLLSTESANDGEEMFQRNETNVLPAFNPFSNSTFDRPTESLLPREEANYQDFPLKPTREELEYRLFCDAGTQSPSDGVPKQLENATQTSYYLSEYPAARSDNGAINPTTSFAESETSSYIYKYKSSPINIHDAQTQGNRNADISPTESQSPSASSSSDSSSNSLESLAKKNQCSPLDNQAPRMFSNASRDSSNAPQINKRTSTDSQDSRVYENSLINSREPQSSINSSIHLRTLPVSARNSPIASHPPPQMRSNSSVISQTQQMHSVLPVNSQPRLMNNSSSMCSQSPQIQVNSSTNSHIPPFISRFSPVNSQQTSPVTSQMSSTNRQYLPSSSQCPIAPHNSSMQSGMSDVSSITLNRSLQSDVVSSRSNQMPPTMGLARQVVSDMTNGRRPSGGHLGSGRRLTVLSPSNLLQFPIEEEVFIGPTFNSVAAVGGNVDVRDAATQHSTIMLSDFTQTSTTAQSAASKPKTIVTTYQQMPVNMLSVPSVLMQVSELGSISSMTQTPSTSNAPTRPVEIVPRENKRLLSTRDVGTQSPMGKLHGSTPSIRLVSQNPSVASNVDPCLRKRPSNEDPNKNLRTFVYTGIEKEANFAESVGGKKSSIEVLVSEQNVKIPNVRSTASKPNEPSDAVDIGVQWSKRNVQSKSDLATQTSFYCSHMPRLGHKKVTSTPRAPSSTSKRDGHMSEFDRRELSHTSNKPIVKKEKSPVELSEPNAVNKSCNEVNISSLGEPDSKHLGSVSFQVHDVEVHDFFLKESKEPMILPKPRFPVMERFCEAAVNEERHILTADLGVTNPTNKRVEEKAFHVDAFSAQTELRSLFGTNALKSNSEIDPCFSRKVSYETNEAKQREAYENRVSEPRGTTMSQSTERNLLQCFAMPAAEIEETELPLVDSVTLDGKEHQLLQKGSVARTVANNSVPITTNAGAVLKKAVTPTPAPSQSSCTPHGNTAAIPGGLLAPAVSRKDWNPRLQQAVNKQALDEAIAKLENWDSHVHMTAKMMHEKNDWPRCQLEWNGKLQSPIVIDRSVVKDITLPPLTFKRHFDTMGSATMTNVGNAVEMKFMNAVQPVLSGGPLYGGTYQFDGMQLHWGTTTATYGSSHKVGDKFYPMEIHLVHYLQSIGSFKKAVDELNGVAIVAFFLEAGGKDDLYFEDLLSALAKITRPHASAKLSSETLKFLAKSAHPTGYFTYPGSLTDPPYSESVVWIVYPNPIAVSHRQVAEYRKLSERSSTYEHQDFRPFQPLNNRPVFFAR